ncbi:MAG: VOC family protein [Nitratireductor sp.]
MRGSSQAIIHVALVVRDYDEALAFYCGKLGFELIEDSYQPEQDKRWVVIAPRGFAESGQGTTILLPGIKARTGTFVGNQSGGRVFLFLRTNDLTRTMPICWLRTDQSSASRKSWITAGLPSLPICTAISGT